MPDDLCREVLSRTAGNAPKVVCVSEDPPSTIRLAIERWGQDASVTVLPTARWRVLDGNAARLASPADVRWRTHDLYAPFGVIRADGASGSVPVVEFSRPDVWGEAMMRSDSRDRAVPLPQAEPGQIADLMNRLIAEAAGRATERLGWYPLEPVSGWTIYADRFVARLHVVGSVAPEFAEALAERLAADRNLPRVEVSEEGKRFPRLTFTVRDRPTLGAWSRAMIEAIDAASNELADWSWAPWAEPPGDL